MATQEQLNELRRLFNNFGNKQEKIVREGSCWKQDAWFAELKKLSLEAAEIMEGAPNTLDKRPEIDEELSEVYKLQENELAEIDSLLEESKLSDRYIAYKKLKQTALETLAKTARSLADFRASLRR